MSGLVVVRHVTGEPKWRCECCPERTPFYAGEEKAYEAHVVACANRHHDEMQGQSLRTIAPGIFDPFKSGDVELDAWIRRYRVPILQGRMTI